MILDVRYPPVINVQFPYIQGPGLAGSDRCAVLLPPLWTRAAADGGASLYIFACLLLQLRAHASNLLVLSIRASTSVGVVVCTHKTECDLMCV